MSRLLRLLSVCALVLLPVAAAARLTPAHAAATCASTSILRVAGWSGADQESTLVVKGIAAFEKANPCIVAYYQPIVGNYQQKIQIEFASKNEPDVFYVSPDMMPNEGKAGLLLKLDPYLAKDHVKLNAYIPALLHTFQLGGATYGLPKDWNTLGIFYNKAIFKAKGIPFPTNNMTYGQFRALAKSVATITSSPATTVYGAMMPEDWGRFIAFLYGFGSPVFNTKTNTVLFNNPKAVAALTYYTSLQTTDGSATVPSTVGDGWQGDSFGKGKVAMVFEGGWLTPYLHSTYPKTDFGVAKMPVGPAGAADPVYTNAWGASARTADPAAAAKLIEYLTGVTYQDQQLRAGFALPTLTSVQSDPFLKTHPEVANLYASASAGMPGNFGQYNDPVTTALTNAITAVLLKKATPAQALAQAAKSVQSQLTAIP